MSPICPKITGTEELKTNFKKDLLEYIDRYRARPLQFWHKTIDEHDFSSVKYVDKRKGYQRSSLRVF